MIQTLTNDCINSTLGFQLQVTEKKIKFERGNASNFDLKQTEQATKSSQNDNGNPVGIANSYPLLDTRELSFGGKHNAFLQVWHVE